MLSPQDLEARLRADGRKVTPQRRRIIDALDGTTAHPTAESIWAEVRRELPSLSLKTVYQTLNDLAEMGEIQALDLGTGATRFDPNVRPHHHLVCTGCGRTHDLGDDLTPVSLPADQFHGFEVEATEIVFRGRCPECLADSTTSLSSSASTIN